MSHKNDNAGAESGYVSSYDSRVRGLKTAERFCLLPANVAPSAMTSGNTSAKELAGVNAQSDTARITTTLNGGINWGRTTSSIRLRIVPLRRNTVKRP